MDKHKITITKVYEFSAEDINDLVRTALEGGINYWCGRIEAVMDERDDTKYKGVAEKNYSTVMYLSDLISSNGELILFDIEGPERWTLTLEKLLNGIKMYCEKHNVPIDTLMEMYDAESADFIIQYALFNEIVFG